MNEMLLKKIAKSDQSGQALIEYVLLLAISVALIIGLMNQLYKPFGQWAQNYMGAYLECLIDIGELPSLGYDGGSGECNAKFEKGSLAGGRPPKAGQGRGANSSSSSGGSGSDDSSNSGGSGGSAGSGSRRSAGSMGFPVGGNTGADGAGAAAGSKTMTEALPASSYFRLRSSSAYSVSTSQSGPRAQGISGVISAEQQKIKKREQRAFTASKIDNRESDTVQKGKKLIVKPVERKVASEEEQTPWGFSQYLKYALILIIIIAIVLFLAGQAMQISKSMEK